LLVFGDQVIDTPDLKVPHPQMHLRSFVLHGLAHLNPGWTHPVMDVTVVELKDRLNGGDFFIDPDRPKLISIAGNIGVGKTTLAEQLGLGLGAEVLYEPYDTNPFMPEVYAGRQELALDSELYFFTNRVAQLSPDRLQGDRLYVADYLFDNDMMYARRLLDDRQMALYQAIYGPLSEHVLRPVLVIYLTDRAERCLDRIHTRNRAYEQGIQVPFLQDLAADYQAIFERWRTCPVIRLDMGHFSCLDRDAMEALCRQVRYYIHDKVLTKGTSNGDHRNH
jgi:deoxyadenosine/deoxycytidine kinase